MSDSEKVELVKVVFSGLKDLGLVAASVATIWIQTSNSGKTDAIKTQIDSQMTKLVHTIDAAASPPIVAAKRNEPN